MVVCKFFQQGSCRYGQNCRFDHIYGSKYSYHASTPSESTSDVLTDDQLFNLVHTDLQPIIRGSQWLLSSYAPFKEKAAIPGLVDMSPEEARLLIYEAKANNSLDQAVAFMNNLSHEAKQKYELLLTKNVNITKALRSLYNGENIGTLFGNLPQPNASTFGNNNASSVFRSAVQLTSASMFSQNTTPSMFAQDNAFATPDPAKSIFAQASQTVFPIQNQNQSSIFGAQSPQPNIFAQPEPMAQSIFAQAAQNAFGQNAQPAPNVFNIQNAQDSAASIFANASQAAFTHPQPSPFNNTSNQPTDVFKQTATQNPGFGAQNVFGQQSAADSGVHSRVEDIGPEDMEAFNANEFKMGFIPEIAPPQSLCI